MLHTSLLRLQQAPMLISAQRMTSQSRPMRWSITLTWKCGNEDYLLHNASWLQNHWRVCHDVLRFHIIHRQQPRHRRRGKNYDICFLTAYLCFLDGPSGSVVNMWRLLGHGTAYGGLVVGKTIEPQLGQRPEPVDEACTIVVTFTTSDDGLDHCRDGLQRHHGRLGRASRHNSGPLQELQVMFQTTCARQAARAPDVFALKAAKHDLLRHRESMCDGTNKLVQINASQSGTHEH